MRFFIKTFGCQQNIADSERLTSYYSARGYSIALNEIEANLVVINSCMIRDKAEERVYGYIRNLQKLHRDVANFRIILTGCIVGAALREPSGKMKKKLESRIPNVQLLSMDEVGFEYEPKRFPTNNKHGWVIVSNGCNNYCTFCIVPFSRGKEVSRPYEDIVKEVKNMAVAGYESVTLLGQNVNSYGSDIVLSSKKFSSMYALPDGKVIEPVFVQHLGRHRIPTLFPYLLEEIAHIQGIKTVTFTSSNPWDFSDELIQVIARNKNIDRLLHIPVQSGSNTVLKNMNRWYTRDEYLNLIEKIKSHIPEVEFITDIIVGFPGETEADFNDTVLLAKEAGFVRAFIAYYSPRPGTVAKNTMNDTVSIEEKKRRFRVLNEIINKSHHGISEKKDWIRRK